MTVSEYNICVRDYSDNIYRFVLRHIRNVEKAEDIVQDVFEKVWIKVEDVSFEKAKSYLFQAAYNTMIDSIRKDSRLHFSQDIDSDERCYQKQTDLQEVLHNALKRLPQIQQSVILLRDYEGYSYEEIGDILSLNESQVKVYIFRARKNLRDYLKKIEYVIE
jgi:RNA polymerase sigma factor (sigma-70 family)